MKEGIVFGMLLIYLFIVLNINQTVTTSPLTVSATATVYSTKAAATPAPVNALLKCPMTVVNWALLTPMLACTSFKF